MFISLPSIEEVVSPTQSPPKAKENLDSPLNKDTAHGDGAPISPHRTLSPNDSSDVMSVMMTNTTSLEEQVAKMSKILEALTDSIKEKD